MKLITKLTLIAASVAALASPALADDQQLRQRIDTQRAQTGFSSKSTTVAVYAGRHGVSRTTMVAERERGSHFELRTNAKGHTYGVFVPNK